MSAYDVEDNKLFVGDRVEAYRDIRLNVVRGLRGTVFNVWPPGFVKLSVLWDNGVRMGLASPRHELIFVSRPAKS